MKSNPWQEEGKEHAALTEASRSTYFEAIDTKAVSWAANQSLSLTLLQMLLYVKWHK